MFRNVIMTRSISHLVFDFDKTLTTHDTLQLVAAAAYTRHNPLRSRDTRPSSAPGLPSWDDFTNAYLSDQKSHTERFGPRPSLQRELSYLASLKSVEQASVGRVEASGLFRGVTDGDIRAQAASVKLRKAASFCSLAGAAIRAGTELSIISVTWSTVFVNEVLRVNASKDEPLKIEVRANDIVMDEDGSGTGKLTKKEGEGIATGEDKLRILRSILEEDGQEGLAIYVGDSVTDLPPLLEADVGIVVGNDEALVETCDRVGVRLEKSLEDVLPKQERGDKVLYRIEDWSELMPLVGGRPK